MENPKAILVISGAADRRTWCQEALADRNVSLRLAASLPEGFTLLRGEPFDLAILDAALLWQPGGEDLWSQIRREKPEVGWILIGTDADIDRALRTFADGVDDLLPFPSPAELLWFRVRRGLENQQNSLELKRLQAAEMFFSQLWSLTKGQMDGFEQFNKDFVGAAAFRLTVAHEFRAPLAALQSFLMLLAKGYIPPDQQAAILQHAIDRGQDLLDLVDDLMDLATTQEEQAAGRHSTIRVGDELEKVLPALEAQARSKGLTLSVEIQQNPAVMGNSIHLRQIWTNLISNAIKYTPQGGRVRIVLDRNETFALGMVEDTGIGIAPEDQELIFHEFYRTPQAREWERRGTGLGLPIVKRIVEGYGGRVEVESALGKGSRFRFRLPLSPDPAEPRLPSGR
jgi:signal transduction histidine kinase